MSDYVFPSLPGLTLTQTMRPKFSTKTQRSVSLSEARAAFAMYPLWSFTLRHEFLRHGADNDLRQLAGFFGARKGSWDSFLYSNPDDSAVVDQQFGIGDGTKTQFQLMRTFGYSTGATFDEPVMNVASITNVKKAGVAQSSPSNYSVSATGVVTFVTAPGAGQALTWTGSYYYRVRFASDEMDLDKFLQDLFEQRGLELVGSPANKV